MTRWPLELKGPFPSGEVIWKSLMETVPPNGIVIVRGPFLDPQVLRNPKRHLSAVGYETRAEGIEPDGSRWLDLEYVSDEVGPSVQYHHLQKTGKNAYVILTAQGPVAARASARRACQLMAGSLRKMNPVHR